MWRPEELERWRRAVPATYKARGRGTHSAEHDMLKARYDGATRGKRLRAVRHSGFDPLFAATGDPLVHQDRELAARVYGLAGASRPSVALRHIRAAVFGDALSGITDMAIWFQRHRRWSTLRAAGEAVALAAERGNWIGVAAPVSFDRAVELVRKSVGRMRAADDARYSPRGWTGRELFVIPAPGRTVRMPRVPREFLPAGGGLVPDDAFWRRRLVAGDVLLGRPGEENPTTR